MLRCVFYQVTTPISESTRCTRPQNSLIISESEYESDSSIVSAPSYSMITVTDDNTNSVLADEQTDVQSDVIAIENVEVVESIIHDQPQEEITVVSDV